MRGTIALCVLLQLMTSRVHANVEVIIVGGGVAGLSAARELLGVDGPDTFNVTVLEANPERLGGRVWTKTIAGAWIDLGNSYLDNAEKSGNPIAKLADGLEIDLFEADGDSETLYKAAGVEMTEDEIDAVWEGHEQTVKDLAKGHWDTDQSIYDVIQNDDVMNTAYEMLGGRYYSSVTTEFLFGAPVEDVSAKLYGEHEYVYDSSDYFITEGFYSIVDGLVNGKDTDKVIDYKLGQKVTAVEYDSKDRRVTVKTAAGDSFTADKVLIAVPLGVLKEKDGITFSPKLDKKKKNAINKIGVGTINKLILEFSEAFWPDDSEMFGIASEGSDASDASDDGDGMLEFWINMNMIVLKPILMGHAIGKAGVDSEDLSDEEFTQKGLEKLSYMFGLTVADIQAKLVTSTRTKWLADEFAKGSTAFYAVGNTEGMFKDAESFKPDYLYFAGDYTSLDHVGTVRGAFESGERAAEEMTLTAVSGATVTTYSLLLLLALPVISAIW